MRLIVYNKYTSPCEKFDIMAVKSRDMKLPQILITISDTVQQRGAKAIVVGGSVRDHYLQLPIKDYDIEVFGLDSLEELEEILGDLGSVNLVGKSFGVLKFSYDGDEYDFSFPRREEKISDGHRGFDVSVDAGMDFKEAALRRDFTINAMGYDIAEKKFIDPYGGLEDIKQKTLRHIDDITFIEDPLRVYRAVQFCARFEYELADSSFRLCREMVSDGSLEELAKERVYIEWKKLLSKALRPSIGLELFRKLGVLRYFPELEALIGTPQSPKWHPEGDVWIHTLLCVDAMAVILYTQNTQYNEEQKILYLFAILCHDLGKPTTTTIDDDGNIKSIGHEHAGVPIAKSFMGRLTDEHSLIEGILPLVEQHLKPSQFYRANSSDKAIRRLATKVSIEDLVVVAKADFLGRTTDEAQSGIYRAGEWLLERSKLLSVKKSPLANLLQGRDLVELGFEPSPKFGKILDEVYELQLDGIINNKDEAIAYIKEKYIGEL